MTESTIAQKLSAEVLGTFVLVLFGCGSVVVFGAAASASDGNILPTTITTIGLAFGLAVMVMAYAFGRVSGAHFNPAVSVGAGVGGRMSWSNVGLYVVAQLVGAILGALVLFILMQGFEGWDSEGSMGQNSFGDQGSGYAWWAAFLLELVLTAIFVTVILAVTDERNEHPVIAPLAIGFTLSAIHFVAIPATGTSVNPARSIGPALFAGSDAIMQLWLFILAPLLGGVIAGLLYPLVFGRVGEPIPGSGLKFSRPPRPVPAAVPGYGAPDQYQQQWNQESTDTYAGTAGAQAASPYAAQPIVQDGWQWDPVGQQWHPVGQTPEQWQAQQAAQQPVQTPYEQTPVEQAPVEQAPVQDQPPYDDGTQIRPPS